MGIYIPSRCTIVLASGVCISIWALAAGCIVAWGKALNARTLVRHRQAGDPYDAVIVCGQYVRVNKISAPLRERVILGVKESRARADHLLPVVFTGGMGFLSSMEEAHVAADWARRYLHLDPKYIQVEACSESTFENALLSRVLLEENAIIAPLDSKRMCSKDVWSIVGDAEHHRREGPIPVHEDAHCLNCAKAREHGNDIISILSNAPEDIRNGSVIVVSDTYHIPRVKVIFEQYFARVDVVGVSPDLGLLHEHGMIWDTFKFTMREPLAWVENIVMGKLSIRAVYSSVLDWLGG